MQNRRAHRFVRASIGAALLAALSVLATPVSVADRFTIAGAESPLARPEPILAQVFRDIETLRLDRALARIETLVEAFPNFRLGHLIKGDLLLARARPLATIGNADNAPADRLADLREEAIARLRGYNQKPPVNQVPRALLQLTDEQKYALVVDTSRSRLYVYQNEGGRPHHVADYYITQGKAGAEKMQQGDRKTPVGVYFVTSSLPKKRLSDFYGSGAFPLNYPNEWDRRMGRNGYGIWLHGTPSDTFSRPPRASDGCVVLSNLDLDEIAQRLQIGVTPVVIAKGVEWVDQAALEAERQQLLGEIDQWRRDWQGRDVERYLAHYSPHFTSDRMNYAQWVAAKRDAARGRTGAQVETRGLSILRDPSRDDLAVVSFEQDYRSNTLSNVVKKRQYWIREEGSWKIIYEGTV